MSAHALLSPSAAHRWLTCTPSARLEARYPETTSDAAEEGTLAHALGEYKLRLQYNCGEAATPEQLDGIRRSKWYSEEMNGYATAYADFVSDRFAEAVKVTPDAVLFVETKLDLRFALPDAFGTADAVIIADGLLQIIDLKYGKGVAVSAERNKQMMIYALGALHTYRGVYAVDRVQMYIYQPRLDSCTSYTMTAAELEEWAREELQPRAKVAYRGEGELVTGDHCRFCKHRVHCAALAEQAVSLAIEDFEPERETDASIERVLKVAETVTGYINAVKEYALAEALKGRKWDGFKLVEGRSTRRFTDEEALVAACKANGIDTAEFFDKKLKGVPAIEKLLGKADFADLAAPFVAKPAGAPTLVPVTDKRPEYSVAAAEFKDC